MIKVTYNNGLKLKFYPALSEGVGDIECKCGDEEE